MSGAPTADLQIPVSATQDPQRRIPETSTSTRIDNDQGIDLEDVVRRACRVVFHPFILVPTIALFLQ